MCISASHRFKINIFHPSIFHPSSWYYAHIWKWNIKYGYGKISRNRRCKCNYCTKTDTLIESLCLVSSAIQARNKLSINPINNNFLIISDFGSFSIVQVNLTVNKVKRNTHFMSSRTFIREDFEEERSKCWTKVKTAMPAAMISSIETELLTPKRSAFVAKLWLSADFMNRIGQM